jgi:hypothetical protein
MLYFIFQLLAIVANPTTTSNMEQHFTTTINEPIVLQILNYENLPDSLRDQFEGAGCTFSKTSKSKSIAITTEHMAVKIDDAVEVLKQAGDKNGGTLYKNKTYQCIVKFGKTLSQGEGGGTSKATLTIKRIKDTKATIIAGIMWCGC